MKRIKQPPHAISGVFVFLLLGIFAVFSTVMVLLGARAYQGTADRAGEHNTGRIAPAYLRSMVRSGDGENALRTEEISGIPAIVMNHVYDGEPYVTRIYVYDGMLREWFSDADMEFEPENGEAVCPADALTARMQDGLLTVNVSGAGEEKQIDIALRTAR